MRKVEIVINGLCFDVEYKDVTVECIDVGDPGRIRITVQDAMVSCSQKHHENSSSSQQKKTKADRVLAGNGARISRLESQIVETNRILKEVRYYKRYKKACLDD